MTATKRSETTYFYRGGIPADGPAVLGRVRLQERRRNRPVPSEAPFQVLVAAGRLWRVDDDGTLSLWLSDRLPTPPAERPILRSRATTQIYSGYYHFTIEHDPLKYGLSPEMTASYEGDRLPPLLPRSAFPRVTVLPRRRRHEVTYAR